MADLKTTYGGIALKNPFIASSGPPTHTPEACEGAAKGGFAGVVLKTNFQGPELLRTTVGRPVYRVADWRGLHPLRLKPPKKSDPLRPGGRRGFKEQNWTLPCIAPGLIGAYMKDDDYLRYINETKERVSKYDCKVIASISAFTKKRWESEIALVNKSDADGLELNLACPHGIRESAKEEAFPGVKPGIPPAAIPEVTEAFTSFAVERSKVPVMAKLNAQTTDNLSCAKAIQKAGGKGLLFTDSGLFPGLRIDIENAQPGWDPDYPCFNSYWGPMVLMYVCGNLANFRINGVNIDLSGSGGIIEFQDIVRLIMAGASSVQPCRVLMIEGWEIVEEWLQELNSWMDRKGYKNIQSMKGIAADKVITDYTKLPLEVPLIQGGPEPSKKMTFEKKKCISCGWCRACCNHCAIEMVGEYPVINYKKCEVCGMCEAICPTEALTMVKVLKK